MVVLRIMRSATESSVNFRRFSCSENYSYVVRLTPRRGDECEHPNLCEWTHSLLVQRAVSLLDFSLPLKGVIYSSLFDRRGLYFL